MSWKVTTQFLTHLCDRITAITGAPTAPIKDGKHQKGAYLIEGANGGHCLRRIVNSSGSDEDVFRCGHVKPLELANLMAAYIKGIETGKGLK